jgi:hypothetical protein
VYAADDRFYVNPRDYTFSGGEDVVVICDASVELSDERSSKN